eukprot:Em0001g3314a
MYAAAVMPLIKHLTDKNKWIQNCGHRFLGGFVGEKDEVHDFVLEKVTTWTSGVNKLAEAAEFYPQAAFAALSKNGALGVEGKAFMRLLSEKIAATWHKSNSEVMGYVRARLMFAILRATNLCIRGSRVKWRRRMEIEDGAGLPYMQE